MDCMIPEMRVILKKKLRWNVKKIIINVFLFLMKTFVEKRM